MKYIDGGICAAKGFMAGGTHCGIRPNRSKYDLAMIFSKTTCVSAGLYTTNEVKAAPVIVDIETGRMGNARAICVNSGIANACAPNGMENAYAMQKAAADALGIPQDEVLIGSTGIIGQELNIAAVQKGIDALKGNLIPTAEGSDAAANAILTTDTVKKEYACEVEIGGSTVTMGGISKGSGMIHPNMGTMLCYITTDVNITKELLYDALKEVCNVTFNRISVDGDTSTNDSLIALANGEAGNDRISEKNGDYYLFVDALRDMCTKLARDMAADGEGAQHLITCTVKGAVSEEDAEKISKSVISSTLTKCAIFACDANWGRVLCAMGYAGVAFNQEKVEVSFVSEAGEVKVCSRGKGVPFDEDFASRVLAEPEVLILIELDEGMSECTCWGCDMTYDYVEINSAYRS
jgi:glutamate N-acetyltransferase/amino-acid N-acetyltransferase